MTRLHETHVCRDCGAEITLPYAKPDATLEGYWERAYWRLVPILIGGASQPRCPGSGSGGHRGAGKEAGMSDMDKPMVDSDRRPYNHPLRRLSRAWRDPFAAVMHAVGDHTVGGNSVPLNWWTKKITSLPRENDPTFLSLSSGDDAFGMAFRRVEGDPADYKTWIQWDHVYLDLNRRQLRAVWWTILCWFAADWFGLRRRIYYWALTRHLDRTRQAAR